MELEEFAEIVADVLGISPDEVELEASFTDDLGADSLDLFQMISEVESRLGIEISDEKAFESIVTVEDALNAINENV